MITKSKINNIDQNIIILPFNSKNKLISKYDIHTILKKYGVNINVKNIDIFQRALTHRSYINRPDIDENIIKRSIKDTSIIPLQEKSNERLEFLGDTVIKLIISKYLFERYPEEDEGFMTRLKIKIENGKSLANLAKIIGIDDYVLISQQIESNSGRSSIKILEDVFESFIGALFLDSDYNTCDKFIRAILESEIDYAMLLYKDNNYKDQLLRYYHKMKWSHPIYDMVKESGPSNKKIFTIVVKDNDDNKIGVGIASSKKMAEQNASKQALIYFKQLNDDQIYEEDEDSNIYNLVF
jgi:ribonuclease III